MFSTRLDLADNEELYRQQTIQRVILFGKKPTTFLEKKGAAIAGHPAINPIAQAKILKYLPHILTFIDDETDLYETKAKKRIVDFIKSVELERGDEIVIPARQPILALQPENPPVYDTMLDIGPTVSTNISEFEALCFNNKTQYRYYTNTNFAAYLYQNLLYSLNADNVEELVDNVSWQARLAVLLNRTNVSDYVATSVFYDDTVQYLGVVYDSSFVPKYDVRNLSPQRQISNKITNQQLINYYYDLNVKSTKKVPSEYIGIFMTFPFKDGHYIQPNGQIVYLGNMYSASLKSVRLTLSNLCSISEIESTLDSLARNTRLDWVINYAIHSANLLEQAVALMIIRRLVGPTLTLVGSYRIHLPSELNILSWTKLACSDTKVILPLYYPSKDTPLYVSLVQDIAQSCYTKLGASMMCSPYRIPEVNMREVYDNLNTDAEKYIFFTIILQSYALPMYDYARRQLQPEFGRSIVDLSRYPISPQPYIDSTLADRLDTLTEPLIAPTDINAGLTICPPYKCIEMYEFTNPQLKQLCKIGQVELTPMQMANFLTLVVY